MKNDKLSLISVLFILLSVLYGLHLRVATVTTTEVVAPIRADAADYFNYAVNLANHSIYSKERYQEGKTLKADALRSPGFPFFASLFVSESPYNTLQNTIIAQTFVQVLCFILLSFALYRCFGPLFSTLPIFFLWTFPHFISFNAYFLTESLFISCLGFFMAALWFYSQDSNNNNRLVLLAFIFSMMILVRPIVQYFPLFLLLVSAVFAREFLRKVALFTCVALLPLLLWKVRTFLSVEDGSGSTLVINALFHGSYPNFMYNNDPSTFGFPYHADPNQEKYYEGVMTTLGLIWERAIQEPASYLYWYLIGKQQALWQWGIIAGQGDIFIYPVSSTPFVKLADMAAIRSMHECLHNFWVFGAGLMAAYSLFRRHQSSESYILWRIASLFCLYVVLVHILIAPFPRYGAPFKLVLLLFFGLFLKEVMVWIVRRLNQQKQ